MADLPTISPEEVSRLTGAMRVREIGRGGQKIVFAGEIAGESYALKFVKVESDDAEDLDELTVESSVARVRREVETMRECNSPHLVQLGPIGLLFTRHSSGGIVYFSEELIRGDDLRVTLRTRGKLHPKEIVKLGVDISQAIAVLWSHQKVHRDIKPANIMRRDSDGSFVLLDAGLAFDMNAPSISICPVGTPIYFAPEQFDFTNRRTLLDFRTDIFSLGVTMYELATAAHPFYKSGDPRSEVYDRIQNQPPTPPSSVDGSVPTELSDLILQMLGKSPHLRFRKIDQLLQRLKLLEV